MLFQEKEKREQIWREHLMEKRKTENEMNERKMALMRKEEQIAKEKLEQNLAEKEQRAAAVLQAAASSKVRNQN
jgi:ribosomal protein L35